MLMSTSPRPKTSVGRTTANEIPDSASAASTAALPRKYAYGDAGSAFVTLSWTTRWTPAARAASKSATLFRIAASNVVARSGNRIQYVL